MIPLFVLAFGRQAINRPDLGASLNGHIGNWTVGSARSAREAPLQSRQSSQFSGSQRRLPTSGTLHRLVLIYYSQDVAFDPVRNHSFQKVEVCRSNRSSMWLGILYVKKGYRIFI